MPPLTDSGAAAKLPINVVILGAASVGKTALTLQFVTNNKVESESCQPTIETSFYKEIKINSNFGTNDAFDFKDESTENQGVECLWKMFERERKHSNSLQKLKVKGSNNNLNEDGELRTVLKVTDTASYKPAYNSRKSLKERLAKKLTPRRRAPVSSPDGPVRRRYLRNTDSSMARNAVPSFIYRKTDGKSTMHDSAISSADAFILVYSVQDIKSFDTLQQIRSHIHAVRGCPCAMIKDDSFGLTKGGKGRNRRPSSSLSRGRVHSCCTALPSIAVVGTHIDLTVPLSSPCCDLHDSKASSNESLLNYAFTFTPKQRNEAKKLILQKQKSIAPELLSETSKPKSPAVPAERVRGVVGSWSECVGYAEISNDSVQRVHRIFGHLASQVAQSRQMDTVARKRVDSVLSVFSKKSESDNSTTCSCWPF